MVNTSEKVVIAGGSGLVGSRLKEFLEEAGYRVYILTRNNELSQSSENYLFWNPSKSIIDKDYFQADHVINLCGAGIADKRWTKQRKSEILHSRLQPTNFLIESAQKNKTKFKSFISSSAIGYYGDTGSQEVSESSGPIRHEFLSDICVQWEEAGRHAEKIAQHVSIIRIGTVLSRHGGALSKMAMTIPAGIANYMGNGKQFMSWIHIDDLSRMIIFLIDQKLSGIYNGVAPASLTNREFTEQLKRVINPKALLLPAPAFTLKIMLGEMSRLLLNSSRINAEKILTAGFEYKYPVLVDALSELYKKD